MCKHLENAYLELEVILMNTGEANMYLFYSLTPFARELSNKSRSTTSKEEEIIKDLIKSKSELGVPKW